MRNYKHRHFYRLWKRWSHPNGYIFYCPRCSKLGLYSHILIRYNDYWKKVS